MCKSRCFKSKGFTLIELLAVVTILAILASLILPRFGNQAEKMIAAEAVSIMGTIKRAEFRRFDDTNTFTGFFSHCASSALVLRNLGLDLSDSCSATAANNKWLYRVFPPGPAVDPTVVARVWIVAQRIRNGDIARGDTLTLDIAGPNANQWRGTGSYADPTQVGGQGPNWPNLNN